MDLKQHLLRQMAFSHATFGPGTRTKGVVDHIRKELVEVEEGGGDSAEWVDVVILALDGLTRQLAYCNGERQHPETVAEIAAVMIAHKQARNEARDWPDWRTADQDKAIEHGRTASEPAASMKLDAVRNLERDARERAKDGMLRHAKTYSPAQLLIVIEGLAASLAADGKGVRS